MKRLERDARLVGLVLVLGLGAVSGCVGSSPDDPNPFGDAGGSGAVTDGCGVLTCHCQPPTVLAQSPRLDPGFGCWSGAIQLLFRKTARSCERAKDSRR